MLDTGLHNRFRDEQRKDPSFRAEYERSRAEIAQVDGVMAMLDRLRAEAGLSKAGLAREIGKNPAAVRRLFTAEVNPELRTVAAIADALDAEIRIVPRERASGRAAAGSTARGAAAGTR